MQAALQSMPSSAPARDRRDEIGAMAAAVEVFKQNAIRVSQLGAEEAARVAEAAQRTEAAGGLSDY